MNYAIEKNIETIRNIQQEYISSLDPWFIGYSGGKDSSALLKLVFLALRELNYYHKPITIVYCDTGVEIPVVKNLVYKTLTELHKEAMGYWIPFDIKVAVPTVSNSFFFKSNWKRLPTSD